MWASLSVRRSWPVGGDRVTIPCRRVPLYGRCRAHPSDTPRTLPLQFAVGIVGRRDRAGAIATDDGPSPFGERLRRLRVAVGLSQEALAERAGLSVEAIGALETGKRRRRGIFPGVASRVGRATCALGEVVADSGGCGGGAGLNAELGEDGGDVLGGSTAAEQQLGGDLLVGPPFGE